MSEQYPRHKIGDEVEVSIDSEEIRATITGIYYTCPTYMYIVGLVSPVEGEFGPQTGLCVPEGILIPKPDVTHLTKLKPIGTYVYVDEDEESGDTIAIDATIKLGTEDEVFWYVLEDTENGLQPIKFVPYNSQEEAEEYARDYIEVNHMAAPGENAAQYLARIEQEGEDGASTD
jgi:hypothetical protein